jgi:hypothetical protein
MRALRFEKGKKEKEEEEEICNKDKIDDSV